MHTMQIYIIIIIDKTLLCCLNGIPHIWLTVATSNTNPGSKESDTTNSTLFCEIDTQKGN